tara:strand:+ start:433 stop:642 length:210 start_codon:yes stop_codon:yes gene_type:complete
MVDRRRKFRSYVYAIVSTFAVIEYSNARREAISKRYHAGMSIIECAYIAGGLKRTNFDKQDLARFANKR